MNAEVRHS